MDIDAESPFPPQARSEYVSPPPPQKRSLWPVAVVIFVLLAVGAFWYYPLHQRNAATSQYQSLLSQAPDLSLEQRVDAWQNFLDKNADKFEEDAAILAEARSAQSEANDEMLRRDMQADFEALKARAPDLSPDEATAAWKQFTQKYQGRVTDDESMKEEMDSIIKTARLESAQAQFKVLMQDASTAPADTDAAKALAARWADYVKNYSDTGHEIEKARQGVTYFTNWTPGPKLGDVRVIDLGRGVKLEMVYIRGGTFQMGSPESEQPRGNDEGPVHPVELDGFWMGKFEVTQEQYQQITGKNPSHFKDAKNPVEQVSWNDAKAFCDTLSQKTGQAFRLPTEAEWEYACRAGSQTAYSFGDSESQLGDYAWYDRNSGRRTHPVGGKRPNAWGLYDMHGNVYEWCGDWYDSDYYKNSPRKNPTGPSSGSSRVNRGGSWISSPWGCRSAFRYRGTPGITFNYLGFRVAASASR